jgi:hypothetical protein
MAQHILTEAERLQGSRLGVLSRREQSRLVKKLAKMDFDKTTIEKLVEFFKVLVASPPGLFLTGSLLIDGLEALGYFGATSNAMPNSPSSPGASNNLLGLWQQVFSTMPGGREVLEVIAGTTGQSYAGGITAGIPQGRINASYLQAGLFSICMVQALGGGAGISTLATAALSALK